MKDVERGVEYQIDARSVDPNSGAASDWVTTLHTVAGLTTKATPTSFAGVAVADGVNLTWAYVDTLAASPDVGFEIQRTTDSAGAPNSAGWATLDTVKALTFHDAITDGVKRWYRVRTTDYHGNASAWATAIAVTPKTVANGATVGATIGPGGNVTGAVDANGRAVIDFTQAGHTGKSLDNIPDGTRAAWDSTTQKSNAVDSTGNLILKNKANATASTSSANTTSNVYSVCPDMAVTITTKGNKVLMNFTGAFSMSLTSTPCYFSFFRDGVQISPEFTLTPANTLIFSHAMSFIDSSPSAASHTYDVRWRVSSGTLAIAGTARAMQVVELG